MSKLNVLITGMSGYLARGICRELDRRDWLGQGLGVDVVAPLSKYDKIDFVQMDVADPALIDRAVAFKPDVVIHLAYVLTPSADLELMERVNIQGSENVLRAVAAAKPGQLIFFSSGTAYGAHPDNPVPLKEHHPLRAHPGFKYSADKARIEKLCQDFSAEHPDLVLTILRPCVVYGPLVNNYLSNLIAGPPITAVVRGFSPPLQFVHEDDVARAVVALIEQRAAGVFNLAPPDWIHLDEVIAISGKPALRLPKPLVAAVLGLDFRLKLGQMQIPPAFLDFLCYPWVMDTQKLITTLGFAYRYSTRETLEIMLRQKGVIV